MIFKLDISSVPLRAEPSHKSEMVNELLFGELFTIIESRGDWHRIQLEHDHYLGWLERKDPFIQDDHQPKQVCRHPKFLAGIYLHPGSWFPDTNQINTPPSLIELEQLAMQFMHVPYVWGGRTLRGIDCSGFTQIIARLAGISIPRDAYEQATNGLDVEFQDARSMDLAFFKNKAEKITHVGFVMDSGNILHASEKVRIDKLDEKGIYRDLISQYTHSFCHLKRIF